MSSRRARMHTPIPGPDEVFHARPAIIADRHEPGILDQARKLSHDALIKEVGRARRSGVWWTETMGVSALHRYLQLNKDYDQTPDPEALDRLTDNPRGALVIAWCLVKIVPPTAVKS